MKHDTQHPVYIILCTLSKRHLKIIDSSNPNENIFVEIGNIEKILEYSQYTVDLDEECPIETNPTRRNCTQRTGQSSIMSYVLLHSSHQFVLLRSVRESLTMQGKGFSVKILCWILPTSPSQNSMNPRWMLSSFLLVGMK